MSTVTSEAGRRARIEHYLREHGHTPTSGPQPHVAYAVRDLDTGNFYAACAHPACREYAGTPGTEDDALAAAVKHERGKA